RISGCPPQSVPVTKGVRLGGQRSQDGAIQLAEEIPTAALPLFEGPMIQPIPQFRDGLVQSSQIKKRPVAQGGDDPTLSQQNSLLHLRLVFWLCRARWNNRHPVVLGHFIIGSIQ